MSTTTHEPISNEAEETTDLPEGWTTTRLGDVVAPSKEKIEPQQRPDAPYLSLEHVESDSGQLIGRGIASDVRSTKTVFHRGDVLYGKLRPYLNKVCIPEFDGICSTDFLVFPRGNGIDNQFLFRFLLRNDVVEYANHHSTGVQLPRVRFEALGALQYPLPPLPEQQRIVTKIDELFAEVTKSRDRLTKVPKILKRFRQSVLAAACSGRLTEDWRDQHPDVEPAEKLIERIRQRREAAGGKQKKTSNAKLDVPDLPELPELWAWARMGQVADVQGGIQKQPKRTPKDNPFPYLRVANVLRDRLDLSEISEMELFEGEIETYRLDRGDLLIVEGNGSLSEIGRSALWSGEIRNCVHQNHIIRVRPIICVPRYLNSYWNSPVGVGRVAEVAVTTAGLYSLSTKKVGTLPVALPPLEEQHEIVRRVEALFALADTIEERVAAATKRADKLTQAILAKAFRGELVPTEAELARQEGREYETAAELLARIKEDRATTTTPTKTPKRKARKKAKEN